MRALQRCEDAWTQGRMRPNDDCTADPTTATLFSTAMTRLYAGINVNCGGANRDCGDGDDLPLASTRWGGVRLCRIRDRRLLEPDRDVH